MNKIPVILTVIGAAFLAFVGGVLVGEFKANPFYSMLKPAFAVADTFYDRPLDGNIAISSFIWGPSRTEKEGVVVHNVTRSFDGYTLLSSGHDQKAFLYDSVGKLLHEWHLPFREAWPVAPHVNNVMDASLIYWSSLHLYPNGDLLASYRGISDFRGYGLVKMDKDSTPIWTFDERASDTFSVGDDGRIYTIVRSIRNEPFEDVTQLICPYIDDEIVILSPEGKELARFSLLKKLHEKVGGKFLSSLDPDPSSILGTSCVDIVSPELARKIPSVEAGNLLVTMSNAGLLVIVDSKDGTVQWVTQGPWRRQHTARPTANGNIVLFDNQGQQGQGLGSSVLVFDPATRQEVWRYAGDSRNPLNSRRWSSVQELPNSNFLVTESQAGRIFEVARDKRVVWEWISPFRVGNGGKYIAAVWSGRRYPRNSVDFEFNEGE